MGSKELKAHSRFAVHIVKMDHRSNLEDKRTSLSDLLRGTQHLLHTPERMGLCIFD